MGARGRGSRSCAEEASCAGLLPLRLLLARSPGAHGCIPTGTARMAEDEFPGAAADHGTAAYFRAAGYRLITAASSAPRRSSPCSSAASAEPIADPGRQPISACQKSAPGKRLDLTGLEDYPQPMEQLLPYQPPMAEVIEVPVERLPQRVLQRVTQSLKDDEEELNYR